MNPADGCLDILFCIFLLFFWDWALTIWSACPPAVSVWFEFTMPLHDLHRRQKLKNLAIGLMLAGLVVMFFLITLAKLNPEPGQ